MPESPSAAAGAKIVIYQSELDRIAGWAASRPRTETGGDLFGYRTRSGVPVVAVALGPGPLARHEAAAFFRDTDFLKHTGKELNQSHGLQYIGEWHSHHQMRLDHPSGGDCHTVAEIFENNPFDDFFLCIVNLRGGNGAENRSMEMTVGAFHFRRGQRAPTTASWVVLEMDSPIAAQIYSDPSLGLRSSEPRRIWTVRRTTLDAPLESLQHVPLGGLMNSPEGNAFFTELHHRLTRAYGNPAMRVFGDGAVSFGFRSAERAFTLSLPNGFPELPATLIRDDGNTRWTRRLPSASRLKPGPFLESIEEFIAEGAPPRPETTTAATREAPVLALAVWMAVAVLALGLFVWWIDRMRGAAVEEAFAGLARQQQSLGTTVDRLGRRLDGLPATVTTQLEPLHADIAALQRGVAATQAGIIAMPDRLAPLSAAATTQVEEAIAHLAKEQQSLSAAVDRLGGRLDRLGGMDAGQLDSLRAEMAALQQSVAATQAEIAAMPDRLAPQSGAVVERLGGLRDQVKALEDGMAVLQRKLNNSPPAVDPAAQSRNSPSPGR